MKGRFLFWNREKHLKSGRLNKKITINRRFIRLGGDGVYRYPLPLLQKPYRCVFFCSWLCCTLFVWTGISQIPWGCWWDQAMPYLSYHSKPMTMPGTVATLKAAAWWKPEKYIRPNSDKAFCCGELAKCQTWILKIVFWSLLVYFQDQPMVLL